MNANRQLQICVGAKLNKYRQIIENKRNLIIYADSRNIVKKYII